MKKLLTALCFMLLYNLAARAQSIGPSALNATGGSRTIGGNTYEYAIGGVVSGDTYEGPGLVVTSGVLQPIVNDPDGIDQLVIDAGALSVFPNPVEQLLFLQPDFKKKGILEYILSDIQGRILLKNKVSLDRGNERQQIDMSHLAAASYSLSVVWKQAGKLYVKAYKIQKVK